MKKKSKVLSIIGASLVFVPLLLMAGLFLLGSIGDFVYGIYSAIIFVFMGITYSNMDSSVVGSTDYQSQAPLFFLIAVLVFIGLTLISLWYLGMAVGVFATSLVNIILGYASCGKKAKKGIHIAGIIFDTLFLCATCLSCFWVGLWIFIFIWFIIAAFVLLLLGHIFGIKAAKEEEIENQKPEIVEYAQ